MKKSAPKIRQSDPSSDLRQEQYKKIDEILLRTQEVLVAEAIQLAGLDFTKEHEFDLLRANGRIIGTMRSVAKIGFARNEIAQIAEKDKRP